MQINFSTISRIIYLCVVLTIMYFLADLAYGWSLNETQEFMLLVFGNSYAKPASWLVQLGQQPLLLLNGLSKNKTVKKICLVAVLCFIGIDAITNVGAFMQFIRTVDWTAVNPDVASLARYTGYAMCVAITFAEEALVLFAGVAFHLTGMIAKDFNYRAPKWFTVDAIQIVMAASGAQAAGINLNIGQDEKPEAMPPHFPVNGHRPLHREQVRR